MYSLEGNEKRIFKCKWSLSGFLKDWTNSFVVCQLALILMNILFVIPWAVQFLSVDLPKRRKERADKIAAQTSGSFSADWRKRRERERERQKDLVRNARIYYSKVETLLYKKEKKRKVKLHTFSWQLKMLVFINYICLWNEILNVAHWKLLL